MAKSVRQQIQRSNVKSVLYLIQKKMATKKPIVLSACQLDVEKLLRIFRILDINFPIWILLFWVRDDSMKTWFLNIDQVTNSGISMQLNHGSKIYEINNQTNLWISRIVVGYLKYFESCNQLNIKNTFEMTLINLLRENPKKKRVKNPIYRMICWFRWYHFSQIIAIIRTYLKREKNK